MKQTSIYERLLPLDKSSIIYEAYRCLHTFDKNNTCTSCYSICPLEAIQPGKPPKFNPQSCQTCFACLTVCPTGAFKADDSVQDLFICVSRLETKNIELVCALHQQSDFGASHDMEAIQIKGCLAGLGVGTLMGMAALDLQSVQLRVDNCSNCPWRVLKEHIRSQVKEANHLAGQLKGLQLFNLIDKLDPDSEIRRPLWRAEDPPLSRRDLFRMVAQRSQVTVAKALSETEDNLVRQPGRDRRRLNKALEIMVATQKVSEMEIGTYGYATLTVSDSCTACGVCARGCPTEALVFSTSSNNSYKLSFKPRGCIGCEICVQVCASKAIEINHHPDLRLIFATEVLIALHEGSLIFCERCNVQFASSTGSKLCPVCQVRRKSPFGSQLPPSLKHLQGLIDKRKEL